MLRRLAPWLAPAAVVLLGGAGPFEGCEQGSDGPPPALPRATDAACFFDEDCVPTGCEALRCIAGSCVEVAPIRDDDGDGHAPPPCGLDCDDRSAAIAPGATELCDLVDQDCDGRVDEDAIPSAIRHILSTNDPTMALASWGDRLVVSDATFFASGGVRTRRLTVEGALGTIEPLLDVPRRVRAVEAAPTAEGAWFAVALERASIDSDPSLALVEVVRDATGAVQPRGEPVMRAIPGLFALALVTLHGEPFVAWDEEGARWAWSPSWPAPAPIASAALTELAALDLATDGTHLVVSGAPTELVFLTADRGEVVSRIETSGALASGRPLESDDGFVWAIVQDAFDHSIQQVTSSAAGRTHTLPTGEGRSLGVDRTRDGLVVTRDDWHGIRAWVLDPASPARILQAYSVEEISGRLAPVVGTTVASTSRGTAILTNFGARGSSLAVLACGAEE